jgi:hypothetical protein
VVVDPARECQGPLSSRRNSSVVPPRLVKLRACPGICPEAALRFRLSREALELRPAAEDKRV